MIVMAVAFFFIAFNNIDELIKKSIVCEVCYEFISVKCFQRLPQTKRQGGEGTSESMLFLLIQMLEDGTLRQDRNMS